MLAQPLVIIEMCTCVFQCVQACVKCYDSSLQLVGVCECVCVHESVCMRESNPESIRDAVNTHLLP